jgi:CheY-like chemotaxis protein
LSKDRPIVLIVDDEADLARSLAEGLQLLNNDIDTHAVHDGQQALAYLETNAVEIVVSDILMPGISGIELLLTIRNLYPQIKVIIITAYGSKELFQQSIKGGAIYYLEKPFDLDYLNKFIIKNLATKSKFSGKLVQINIVEIVQMLGLSGKKVGLKISKAKHNGTIYFEGGKILHAETENLDGIDAFKVLMSLNKGQFTPIPDLSTPTKTINIRWEKLILDITHAQDKAQDVALVTHPTEKPVSAKKLDQRTLEILSKTNIITEFGCLDEDLNYAGQFAVKPEDSAEIPPLVALLRALDSSLGKFQSIRFYRHNSNQIIMLLPAAQSYYFIATKTETLTDPRLDELESSLNEI